MLRWQTKTIDGVKLVNLDLAACADLIRQRRMSGVGDFVMTHNLEHLARASTSDWFADSIQKATISVADGMPLVWASRLQGTPLAGRVNGTDLFELLLAHCDRDRSSVFLAGGSGATVQALAEVLERRMPGIRVAGTYSAPSNIAVGSGEVDDLIEAVKASAPDYVFVGLPSDIQADIGTRLLADFPSITSVGVGMSFAYLTGERRRAPGWMQRSGLEWLFRLHQEPVRLAYRYLAQCAPHGLGLLGRSALVGLRSRLTGR